MLTFSVALKEAEWCSTAPYPMDYYAEEGGGPWTVSYGVPRRRARRRDDAPPRGDASEHTATLGHTSNIQGAQGDTECARTVGREPVVRRRAHVKITSQVDEEKEHSDSLCTHSSQASRSVIQ